MAHLPPAAVRRRGNRHAGPAAGLFWSGSVLPCSGAQLARPKNAPTHKSFRFPPRRCPRATHHGPAKAWRPLSPSLLALALALVLVGAVGLATVEGASCKKHRNCEDHEFCSTGQVCAPCQNCNDAYSGSDTCPDKCLPYMFVTLGPSSTPSTAPSGSPTVVPTTLAPTLIGETEPPTPLPTSMPTSPPSPAPPTPGVTEMTWMYGPHVPTATAETTQGLVGDDLVLIGGYTCTTQVTFPISKILQADKIPVQLRRQQHSPLEQISDQTVPPHAMVARVVTCVTWVCQGGEGSGPHSSHIADFAAQSTWGFP